MVNVYMSLILKGAKRLDEVPASLYPEVREKIVPEAVRRVGLMWLTEIQLLELLQNGNIPQDVYDEIMEILHTIPQK